MLLRIARALDRMGLRSLVARAATFQYPGQSFSVDEDGDWVNAQGETVLVSTVIHVWLYPRIREHVLDHWCRHYTPKKGDVVVDLGSGFGEEAIVFSRLIGNEGSLLAIEAFPDTFRCLQKSVARSRLVNAHVLHAAIGSEEGLAHLATVGSYQSNSIFGGGDLVVRQVTLDFASRDLPRIDFLRANIEGAELPMLAGMAQSIDKVQNACISCHDFMGRPAKRAVTDFFGSHGFDIFLRRGDPAPQGDYVYAKRRVNSAR